MGFRRFILQLRSGKGLESLVLGVASQNLLNLNPPASLTIPATYHLLFLCSLLQGIKKAWQLAMLIKEEKIIVFFLQHEF
jgi:hypothetical protein